MIPDFYLIILFYRLRLFYRIFINSLYFVDFLQMKVIKDCIELVFL